jgi:predicted MFS family arabinose efflux permease
MLFRGRLHSFFMWLMPLSFFAYQFVLRLLPSLTMQDIMKEFAIDATNYGFLASVYYYGYAGAQIPIAIALDKYGARKILVLCATLCGVGMFLFCNTDNWTIALISRFLIGVGSAGGFLTTAKVISQCFPSESYSKMVGLSFSIGLLGAVYSGKPLSLLLQQFNWHELGKSLSFIAIGIALLALLFLKVQKDEVTEDFQIKNSLEIFRSPTILLLAISNLLLVGSLEGFADVWGVNYLVAGYGIEKSLAAEIVSFIPIGMIFGGPLLSLLSKKIGEYMGIVLAGIIMSLCLIYVIFFRGDLIILRVVFFCIGIMCCYQVLVFAIGNKLSKPSNLSIITAFLNCINMLGGAFFHSIIGFSMDLFSDGSSTSYVAETYTHALLVIPFCAVLGSIIIFYLKLSKR